MERNWLIRTSQNQILGPVAKLKLLEFIQKGALGMTDEVTSGNGYWFSLKEKDLVEKYLYGDIPQGYNPISESKSVLSKRDNPEKTTSINSAPANNNATQVIKLSDLGPGLAPKAEDLSFPDITVVKTGTPVLNFDDDQNLKLPTQDDLEFPDMNAITAAVDQSFQYPRPGSVTTQGSPPKPVAVAVELSASGEEIVLPNDDDLAFPDMDDSKTSTKVEKGKVDLAQQYTRTVALDTEQAAKVIPESEEKISASSGAKVQRDLESDFGEMSLSLDKSSKSAPKEEPAPMQKRERLQAAAQVSPEDKKLLHDRKTKSSVKPSVQRDPTREIVHKESDQAEPLKKRNDNYIFFILIILILIIVAIFFYFKEILNKPLPV